MLKRVSVSSFRYAGRLEDCSTQTSQRRRILFCQSLVCSEERRVVHGQLNAMTTASQSATDEVGRHISDR